MKYLLCSLMFLVGASHGEIDPFAMNLPPGTDPFHPDAKKPTTKEFQVSKANINPQNKALFLNLWDALQNPKFREGISRLSFKITQAVGKVDGMSRYLTANEAVVLRDGGLFEGSVVTVWVYRDGVYDFNSVGTGVRRVQQFREAVPTQDPDAPTKDEFVQRLKAGETFSVKLFEEKGCEYCFGDGKLGALKGNKPCDSCNGTGNALRTWVLKW